MKRWMISACLTLVLLCAACVLCTDFKTDKNFSTSPDADNSTFTAVITTVKRKKKTVQKQNIIKTPADVIHASEEKSEEIKQPGEPAAEEIAESGENATESGENEFSSAVQKTGAQIKAEESYKAYALKRIASKKNYPLKARAKGLEGEVKLRIVIGADGELETAEITQPCCHELLNEAALLAVKNSAPFKKKPDTMQKLELNFFMEFKLTG